MGSTGTRVITPRPDRTGRYGASLTAPRPRISGGWGSVSGGGVRGHGPDLRDSSASALLSGADFAYRVPPIPPGKTPYEPAIRAKSLAGPRWPLRPWLVVSTY